uniref:Protein kinase domain-containing protein n=1 Tax=Ananas comosus var. bracteatus TaxID=296719 RepID=A0A6V7NGA1_ANACO|nr:unnamed protein product [Ananas comosus var. bracteatus]
MPAFSKPTVNVQENAQGKYRVYEPGYYNRLFWPVLRPTTQKLIGLRKVVIHAYRQRGLGCNAVQIHNLGILSGKNLTGTIPLELTKLPGLVELDLDGNSLTGQIPDFSGCPNLEYIHLENNKLSGALPSTLADLPNLKELYVQNNKLSGRVPQGLLKKNIIFNYSGNMGLHRKSNSTNHTIIILCSVIGAALLLIVAVACFLCTRKKKKNYSKENVPTAPAKKLSSYLSEVATETAHRYSLSEIEDATMKFERRIGSGGFGIVYYGKLADGKEIAVKLLTNDSFQGIREFLNEVTLLSRIHHRNLVTFLGPGHEKIVSWIKRLEIAEDAAKGIEYLHTGCSPTIIHRDLKSSNILLDKNMRAKVSDFGLSKPAVDGSHISSIVRGTVGYLDPEYYISQQLTEKSDIYSFGVILLELISGHEPISSENFGINCRNIVAWARSHIESGNIQAVIDPALQDDYDMQSVWKIAETAIMCVKPQGLQRPTISEVVKDIQEAIAIERRLQPDREFPAEMISKKSMGSSVNLDLADMANSEHNVTFDELLMQPGLR